MAPCTGPLESYSATTWTVGTHELDELKIGMVCGTAVQQMENVYGHLLYIQYKCWVTNLASNLVQILLSLGSNPAPTVHDVGKRYGIQLQYTYISGGLLRTMLVFCGLQNHTTIA